MEYDTSDSQIDNSKKQALCIASMASNLDNFNRDNVDILLRLGYDVTLAANFHTEEESNSQEKINKFAKDMREKGVHIVHIDFSRKVQKINLQIKSVMQVKRLLNQKFNLIHCHSPICAAIVRMEAEKYRKNYGTKVFYTAHGFHFFDGAPIRNWIFFYPIEKLMSYYTDILITINHEDYRRAKKHFCSKNTIYIPGVGVDIEKFQGNSTDREKIRKELCVKDSDIILLSVGELNENKNHELAIEALSILKKEKPSKFEHIHYFICGQGKLRNYLEKLVNELKLQEHIHFLGYKSDIVNLYVAADIFIFTSKREGLPMSLMEAMAAGLPVICTKIRGNIDLVRNRKEGYITTHDANEMKVLLYNLLENNNLRNNFGKNSKNRIHRFSKEIVMNKMDNLYRNI